MSHESLFNLDSYDYHLPEHLIAQSPANPRDSSRLLVWHVRGGKVEHRIFRDISDLLSPEDLLVLNDTRVLPARLSGTRENSGGAAEILLLSPRTPDFCLWEALVRPGRRLRAGCNVLVGNRLLRIESEEGEGIRIVKVGTGREDVLSFLDRFGSMPLPPYIHRKEDSESWKNSYQTVFAKNEGSVAAPTASLHFTEELLHSLDFKGVQRAWVTLHVGLGTFRPVKTQDIRDHVMHSEHCEIPALTAEAVRECKKRGGRVVAVGTTVARTLESMAESGGIVRHGFEDTRIFIYPGFKYQVVDAMITNFHLPKSSLLMLVGAFAANIGGFAGQEEKAIDALRSVYNIAVSDNYRFFSFGDAMFII